MNKQQIISLLLLLTSIVATNIHADDYLHSRTMVVQITSFDPAEANHGLLFALHGLRDSMGDFGNPPYDLTVKIVFSGEGVLNASKRINNPARIRFETRPEDPKKDTKHLIRALKERHVEMKATGFGLKQFGLSPKDLVDGVKGGGSKIIPRFITSPESDEVVVVTF